MKPVILIITLVLALAITANAQDFPSELIWELSFEENAVSFGTAWSENDEVCALVNAGTHLYIVRNGEITWTSPEIENIMTAARVDFGDGAELVVTTSAGDPAEVHRYFGDNFEQHTTGVYGESSNGGGGHFGSWGSNYQSRSIKQKYCTREDSTRTILIWCETIWQYRDEVTYENSQSGILFYFSLTDMEVIGSQRAYVGSPVAFQNQDLLGNEQQELIFAGNSQSYSYNANMGQQSWSATLLVWDENGDETTHAVLGSCSGLDGNPGVNVVCVYGVAVYEDDEGTYLIAGMQEAREGGFGIFSSPDFERINWVPGGSAHQFLGTMTGENEEQFLIAITSETDIIVYHLPDFQEILPDPFLECNLSNAELGDFNNDGSPEMLVLAGNTLSLFSVGALAAQPSPAGHPASYALDSCFPNPFNSTVTIGYSLPVAEVLSVVVYDLYGREVQIA